MFTPVWIDSYNDSEDDFPEGKKITWKKGSHYTALELNMQARKVGRVGVHAQTYAAWVRILAPSL